MALDPRILLQAGQSVPDVTRALQQGLQTGDMLSQMLEAKRNRPLMRERAQLENQLLEAQVARQQQMNQLGVGGQNLTTDQRNLAEYQRLLRVNPELANQFAQATGFAQRPAVAQPTSSERDFNLWKQLQAQGSPLADEFGRQAGFVTKEGQEVKSDVTKRMFAASDRFNKARININQFNRLADDFERIQPESGIFASWKESLKQLTGSEDAVTQLRKRYEKIKNSQAMASLPPGAASDVDVANAMKPFPKDTADPEFMASFLRGLAKIEAVEADMSEFESDFLAEHGSPRTSDGVSMLRSYKQSGRQQQLLDTLFPVKAAPTAQTQVSPTPQAPDTNSFDESLLQFMTPEERALFDGAN